MDDLGDRMKEYERQEDWRLMPRLPVYARIDGRSFHRFTRSMDRPFDVFLMAAMHGVTQHLIEQTHALIGYTQSDEINLVWHHTNPKSETIFGARIQKMASVLSGMATSKFMMTAIGFWPDLAESLLPHFDARIFALPNRDEVANAMLWRELDATKNAVSMATRCHYSAMQIHGKTSSEQQEMLFAKGVNFNDYPPQFKRGQWFRRMTVEKNLTPDEMARIPEHHRPDGRVLRSEVQPIRMPPFVKVVNRVGVIFDGDDPVTAGEDGYD